MYISPIRNNVVFGTYTKTTTPSAEKFKNGNCKNGCACAEDCSLGCLAAKKLFDDPNSPYDLNIEEKMFINKKSQTPHLYVSGTVIDRETGEKHEVDSLYDRCSGKTSLHSLCPIEYTNATAIADGFGYIKRGKTKAEISKVKEEEKAKFNTQIAGIQKEIAERERTIGQLEQQKALLESEGI